MVFSTAWTFIPFINAIEKIMAKIPRAIDDMTTRDLRLFLQIFLQLIIIYVNISVSFSFFTAALSPQ
jgi:hypothetical protein